MNDLKTFLPKEVPGGVCVETALEDLQRDFAKVLPPDGLHGWSLHLELSASLAPETFVLEISEDRRISLSGGNALGLVFGIYEFSNRYLGVDPLWFWKDIEPARMSSFDPKPARVESGEPEFRYRGWFFNDEDLLANWHEPAGERFLDWPGRQATLDLPPDEAITANYEQRLLTYYTPVVAADVMEMIFEAALRLRLNLLIPASFIDILKEPEAAVIRAAVRRGLFVSQHHVEPLGVSHFAYETWCAKNGADGAPFSYRLAPETLRECWSAYALRWAEIAGEQLIWQVGLRGRGDRALWDHDPEAKARAAELIGEALHAQMEILRAADGRSNPPATLTLWLEGAELICSKQLDVPEGVTYVFADDFLKQEMQEDFHTVVRESSRSHGLYYHIAVWPLGPHLVQGPKPEKIFRILREASAKGDTDYAILNVANLREHVLGAAAWAKAAWSTEELDGESFLAFWAPSGLAPLHGELLNGIPNFSEGFSLYDGCARSWIDRLLGYHEHQLPLHGFFKARFETERDETRDRIQSSVRQLERLEAAFQEAEASVEPRFVGYLRTNLLVQASILRGLYRALAALHAIEPDYAEGRDGLTDALRAMDAAQVGKWVGWYRGDHKVGIGALRNRLQRLSVESTAKSDLVETP